MTSSLIIAEAKLKDLERTEREKIAQIRLDLAPERKKLVQEKSHLLRCQRRENWQIFLTKALEDLIDYWHKDYDPKKVRRPMAYRSIARSPGRWRLSSKASQVALPGLGVVDAVLQAKCGISMEAVLEIEIVSWKGDPSRPAQYRPLYRFTCPANKWTDLENQLENTLEDAKAGRLPALSTTASLT